MSNKIFKNYQINIGAPFNIRTPVNFHTIQKPIVIEELEEVEHVETECSEDIISNTREEADLIIREAELEAARLLEEAKKEADEIRQAVFEEAKKSGYDEAFEEAKKQCEDLVQEAEFIREHARAEYKEVLESIESDVVDTIFEITQKIVGIELSNNKESILFMVKQVFEKCSNKEGAVLRVSPEDYEFIIENKETFLSMVEGAGDVEIKKELSLKAGSCIVETQYGTIDAGANTRLKKIEEAFRQAVGK